MGEVINISKKRIEEELSRGITPLFISHGTNQATDGIDSKGDTLADRVQRIRDSLNRINTLLSEL